MSLIEDFLEIVRQFHHEGRNYGALMTLAEEAAGKHGNQVLLSALAKYFGGKVDADAAGLYDDSHSFESFVAGWGNPPLYKDLGEALAEVWESCLKEKELEGGEGGDGADDARATIVDVGIGGGLAVSVAVRSLQARHSDILHRFRLEGVEKSAGMLETCRNTLRDLDVPIAFEFTSTTAEDFCRNAVPPPRGWDVMESTFAFHNLSPPERMVFLRWASEHTNRFVMVEFDVPCKDGSDFATYVVNRYSAALQEFHPPDAPDDVVVEGFLLPIMLDYFNPSSLNATYEQSASSWKADFLEAGWSDVIIRPIHEYWWGSCFMLIASKSSIQ